MFSLVLATALTAGTAAPEFGFGCFSAWCGPPCCYYPPPCCYYPPPCYSAGWVQPYHGYGYAYYAVPVYYGWAVPIYPPAMRKADEDWKDWKKDWKKDGKKDWKKGPKKGKAVEDDEEAAEAQASVVVRAPMDVEVRFNGVTVKRTSEEQTFKTPAIAVGEGFHYKVTAIAVRDGKTVREERVVSVRAGKSAEVDFSTMADAE